MSEEPRVEKSLVEQLDHLGRQLADAIRLAWESEDRKKLQAEITEGLDEFGKQVTAALDKASQSDAAKQLKEQTAKVAADVRESDVAGQVRKGMLAGLDTANRELGKLLEKLEPPAGQEKAETGAASTPEAPAEAPSETSTGE